jgi:hypothetical protein
LQTLAQLFATLVGFLGVLGSDIKALVVGFEVLRFGGELTKGSICQVPRGLAPLPKFFSKNWWPRVVWSTIAFQWGEASSAIADQKWYKSEEKEE